MQLVEKRDVYSASVVDLYCVPVGIGEIGMRKHAAVIASGEQSVPVRVTGDVVNTLASGTVQRAPVEQGRSFVPPAVNANAPTNRPPVVNPNALTNQRVPFENW
jgi:hypothetical protein